MVKNEFDSVDIESIGETTLGEQKDNYSAANPTLDCGFCGIKVAQKWKNRPKRFCSVECSNKKARAQKVKDTAQRHSDAGKIQCGYCQIEIDAINSQGARRKWCSPDCKSAARVENKKAKFQEKLLEQTECKYCEKSFPKFNSVKGIARDFCSKPCYRAHGHATRREERKIIFNSRQKKIPCAYCGTEMDYLSKSGIVRKFCSDKCRQTPHALKRRKLKESSMFAVSPKDWWDLKARFDHRCAYCGSDEKLTFDHVVPLTRGGTHGIGNALPCCTICNSSKNNRTLVEWRKYLKNLPAGDPRKIKLSDDGAFQGFLQSENLSRRTDEDLKKLFELSKERNNL